ncbi:MAG: DsrE family protein [Desulfobacula sp.]|jgi:predicted peroxiredoxin|nr:DsrE family protein [Desulfobacula sp.]
MAEKVEKIIYFCTHGGEDCEKAAICFAMAGAAVALDIDTTVALQGKGVYLALKGYTDHVPEVGGFAPISKLISDFLEFEGKLLVCKPCIEERNMELSDFIAGVELATGTSLNMAIIESDKQLTF